MAVVGKFSNRTRVMEQLFKAEMPSLTWVDYCGMMPANQLIWEDKADTQTKAMHFQMNSKNKIVKNDLCLAFAQGNQ